MLNKPPVNLMGIIRRRKIREMLKKYRIKVTHKESALFINIHP